MPGRGGDRMLRGMQTTVEIDEALYARLQGEAARRGRSVRDLVADGLRRMLDAPEEAAVPPRPAGEPAVTPPWFGVLGAYAANAAGAHDMDAVRQSIAAGRRVAA